MPKPKHGRTDMDLPKPKHSRLDCVNVQSKSIEAPEMGKYLQMIYILRDG